MENSIVLKGVCKNYPSFQLDQISFNVPKGSIVGLIGENGAGKTTTIKLMLHLLSKDSGTIELLNQNCETDEISIKQNIGVVMDDSFFSAYLNANDINHIMKKFYNNWDEALYFQYLNDFNLPKEKMIRDFSSGMKMKLKIAAAISHHPELLILDEPTSGLDPVVRSEILDIFRDFVLDGEHSILFSSHITTDLEHVADYIVFLHHGKILLTEEVPVLMDEYGIVRCTMDELNKVSKDDYISYRKNKYGVDVLVKSRNSFSKKYKFSVIDKASLEEIMLLEIKGERK